MKSRAKDTSKPPGGSATAESTTRDGGRGGFKEGRRGIEPGDPPKQKHPTRKPETQNYHCDHGGHRQGAKAGGVGWGGGIADVGIQTARAAACNSVSSGREARA
jgi:hypothetical protein